MGGLTLSQMFITGNHCSLSSYNLWWSKEEKKRWGGCGGVLGAAAPISLSLNDFKRVSKKLKAKLSAVNFTIYNQWNMLDSHFPKKKKKKKKLKKKKTYLACHKNMAWGWGQFYVQIIIIQWRKWAVSMTLQFHGHLRTCLQCSIMVARIEVWCWLSRKFIFPFPGEILVIAHYSAYGMSVGIKPSAIPPSLHFPFFLPLGSHKRIVNEKKLQFLNGFAQVHAVPWSMQGVIF